jgi:hypothetical protein
MLVSPLAGEMIGIAIFFRATAVHLRWPKIIDKAAIIYENFYI